MLSHKLPSYITSCDSKSILKPLHSEKVFIENNFEGTQERQTEKDSLRKRQSEK